jgi:putative peptidoglycan lipid II flippase
VDLPSSGAGSEPENDPIDTETAEVFAGEAESTSRVTSTTHAVARAGVLMVLMALFSRLLGMGREMAIAATLGQTRLADVYVAAFRVPDLLFVLLSSGALASVFVPVFTQYLETGRRDRAWYFFSNAATIVGVVITVFVIVGEIFALPLVLLVNPGFHSDPGKAALTADLTRIVLPAQFFFFVGSVLISVQYSHKRFLIPAFGTVVYNLFIIAFGLALSNGNAMTSALGRPDGLGPAAFSWGALAGAFAGNIALQWWGVRRLGGTYRPILDLRDEGVHRFAKLMAPIVFTLSLPQLDTQVNQFFASYLQHGAMAALNYANRLMQMPLGILAQASAIVIFPYIAAQAARNEMTTLRRTLNLSVRTIIAMTVPASIFLIVLAEPIVRVVYQRHEFTASDTVYTTRVLVYYALGIASWSASTVLARGFYALQDTKTPMVTGTFVTFVLVALDYVLVRLMGDSGLALATSIAATVFASALFVRLNKRVGGLHGAQIVASGVKVLLAGAAMAVPTYALRRALTPALGAASTVGLSTGSAVVLLAVCGAAGLAVYAGMLRLLRVDEALFIWHRLAGRLRRNG